MRQLATIRTYITIASVIGTCLVLGVVLTNGDEPRFAHLDDGELELMVGACPNGIKTIQKVYCGKAAVMFTCGQDWYLGLPSCCTSFTPLEQACGTQAGSVQTGAPPYSYYPYQLNTIPCSGTYLKTSCTCGWNYLCNTTDTVVACPGNFTYTVPTC